MINHLTYFRYTDRRLPPTLVVAQSDGLVRSDDELQRADQQPEVVRNVTDQHFENPLESIKRPITT